MLDSSRRCSVIELEKMDVNRDDGDCLGTVVGDKPLTAAELRHKFVNEVVPLGRKLQGDITKKPGTLRVVSYNLHMMSGYAPNTGWEGMLNAIKKLNADVLVLQETTPDTLPALKSLYPYQHSQQFQGVIGNAILSKTLELHDCFRVAYNGSLERGLLSAEVRVPNSKPIRIMCTHLDVYDESGETRLNQATELEMHSHNWCDWQDTIVLGDMNCIRLSDYSEEHLKWIKLQDRSRGVDRPLGFELDPLFGSGWSDVFRESTPCISVWSMRRVDFALTCPKWAANIDRSFLYFDASSDHLPLVVDIIPTPDT